MVIQALNAKSTRAAAAVVVRSPSLSRNIWLNPPGLVYSMNHEELQVIRAMLVVHYASHKQCVTSQFADSLKLHFSHTEREARDGNTQCCGHPGFERELLPGHAVLPVVCTELPRHGGLLEGNAAERKPPGAFHQ